MLLLSGLGAAGTAALVVHYRAASPSERADAEPRDGPRAEPTELDYVDHVLALQQRLPSGFSISLARPFVVVGDGGQTQVSERAQGSVAWAVKRLKQSYFPRDPKDIIDIWLFHNDASYRYYTKTLFHEDPETPYGYYSPRHHALFMNIATGGGTLVHEIVHPFVRANFPAAPPWLNEGLGSLYEQCDEEGGKIVGRPNWRLEGLQRHIRDHSLPAFQSLMAADDEAFYQGEHAATGYAQARYLLYYLQEKAQLSDSYHRFHDARATDPTGYRTLQLILNEPDLVAFQTRWESWVLTLKFPE